jgi:hypothetical protein
MLAVTTKIATQQGGGKSLLVNAALACPMPVYKTGRSAKKVFWFFTVTDIFF